MRIATNRPSPYKGKSSAELERRNHSPTTNVKETCLLQGNKKLSHPGLAHSTDSIFLGELTRFGRLLGCLLVTVRGTAAVQALLCLGEQCSLAQPGILCWLQAWLLRLGSRASQDGSSLRGSRAGWRSFPRGSCLL